jgi:2-polyprenyl-3-methyl-5-hydroxy-6-metoxy-1,4-benzoquinol methylase
MDVTNYQQIESIERHNWWYRGKRDLFDRILTRVSKHHKIEKALDIGCGVGSNLEILHRHAGEVKGIDFSELAVEFCKQKGFKNVVKGDVCNLPKKEKFDVVLCSELLEHVDDAKAIEQINSVLKPGGIFIFSVPAHKYLWNDNDIISHHLRRYKKEHLQELLQNNFTQVRLNYWNSSLFLPTLMYYQLQRLQKNRKPVNNLTLIPKMMDSALYGLLKLENKLFHKVSLPQGISIVGIAKKKE